MLGIRDQGGCRTLYSVKISYKVCNEKTLEDSLVSLPSTTSQLKPTPVQGFCGGNSVQIAHGNLTVLCDSDGEWNTNRLESRCVCKEGMETSFVFIDPPFLEPRNKRNRNTEFMLFILSHYYYLYLSRLCRWGQSKSGLIYKDRKLI